MKKLLFSCVFASSLATNFAQQTKIDFESLNLPQVDTFYNGADQSGGFDVLSITGNSIEFNNSYFTSNFGDYWTGFSYSNMTDVTTPGYSNQYSAITGGGAEASEIYGVYTPDGMISFSQNTFVDSMSITNSTYAYLSMLNGDFFGKQFGSPNSASGAPDGTNGEDFFKVWIVGINEAMQRVDSVEFYLADFRFAEQSQDYIVNTWENVNLTSLGSIRHLTFRFESSDMSGIYINTPLFLALDNLHITNTLSLNSFESQTMSVFPNPCNSQFKIENFSGEISILNFEGKVLRKQNYQANASVDISELESGVYFLKMENGAVTQKITKL